MSSSDGEVVQTILLVDGEVLVRHGLAEYLRDCGYEVVEAADTAEARSVLEDASLAIDLVLCDAAAQGKENAFALARWIRAEHPGLPVLLTGNVEKAAAAAGELCDEGPHLKRPYEPATVVDRIKQRLAERDRKG